MLELVKNILRSVKRRIFQYLGIIILLILVVAAMASLYSNSERLSFGFHAVSEYSGSYDYRIQVEKISDYKNTDNALNRIKNILKIQFPKDLSNYDTIINQINMITSNDIENNLLPIITDGILDQNLQELLLNWGVNYKAILVNDILNNEISSDNKTSSYQIKKSFLKSFDSNQKKKVFFSFEDAFYLETPSWLSDKNLRFNFSPYRDTFNQVYITEGRKPEQAKEVVINPTFAKKHHIALNDEFDFLSGQKLKIVGFGYSYWGIMAQPSIDNINPSSKDTTQVFTTREWINQYLSSNSQSSKITTSFFLKIKNKDRFFTSKIESIFSETFNFNYGNLLTDGNNDYRSGFLKQRFQMGEIVYSAISFFVMLAATFIVLSYVRKEVDLQKKQLGLIKGLGYNNYEIVFGFTVLIFLISIFSTIIGFVLSLPLQIYFNNLSDFGYALPLPKIHFSVLALLVGVVVSTIIFTFASYLQSYSTLTKNPLTLIHDRPTSGAVKWIAFFKKPFNHWSFKPRMTISFALKSMRKLILIFLLFIFVSFLLLFQTIVSDVFSNKIDNLQNYVNSEVYLSTNTFNMYKFNNQGKITSQIYDWVTEKDLDSEKAIKSNMFQIDSEEKFSNLTKIISANNFKDFYIKSEEINDLYHHLIKEGVAYIKPSGSSFISEIMAENLYESLINFFDIFINYNGIDLTVQPLPGIAVGQIILNDNYYPNLEFTVNSPTKWLGHNQGTLLSKFNQVVSLYNDNNQDNPLAWKKWFNLKEEHKLNIDSVFDTTHNLTTEEITYIDGFGKVETQNAYIVPSVISKSLAVLNKYKVGDKVLMTLNTSNTFVPIIFDVEGIISTNLDTSQFYVQIDDLRRVIGYTTNGEFDGQPIQDSFNNYYSKNKTFLPLNSVNIVQSDGDYSFASLQNSWSLIDNDPFVFSLIKEQMVKMFQSVQDVVNITKWLTIVALAFVLFIIVNMILDNNLLIIAMMKASGYRINEINSLIIGSYILALVLAFIIGTTLGYFAWWVIILLVAKLVNITFILPISFVTILITFAIVFSIITIGYFIGLYFIKFKPVSNLLQSE